MNNWDVAITNAALTMNIGDFTMTICDLINRETIVIQT
jgi:hypothetical protein